MSRSFPILLAAALLVAVLPSAHGAATRDWTFTDLPNEDEALLGTFTIGAPTGSNGQVSLPAGERVVWADPQNLSVAADVSGGDVVLDLAFVKAMRNTAAPASILVEYGYVDATGFHAIDSWSAELTQETRNLAVGDVDPSLPVEDAPGTLLEIGSFHGTLVIDEPDAVIPKDAYPAIGLTSEDEDNTLYTEPSFMGSSTQSTATVPLPELPALALLAIGAALVGGVALMDRGRRS